MDTQEYIIINKTALEERMKELKNAISKCILPEQQHLKDLFEQELEIKTQILSQSTPLIPEIQNGIYAGYKFARQNFYNADNTLQPKVQEYILNLKIDL